MQTLKILHCIPDDKFIDGIIAMFDALVDVENDYYVLTCSGANEVRWFKNLSRVRFAKVGTFEFEELLRRCEGEYSGVIFHAVFPVGGDYLQRMGNVPKMRVLWGGDVYSLLRINYFLPKTRALMLCEAWKGGPRQLASYFYRWIYHKIEINSFLPLNRGLHALIRYVSVILPMIDIDVDLLRANYPKYSFPPTLPFQYGVYPYNPKKYVNDGNLILINNSAAYTGNHVDVFHCLKRLGVDNGIVASLSYGAGSEYVKSVVKAGKSIFKDRFTPLLKFMSPTDYFKTIGACPYFVMGHIQQQALGNIFWGLANGRKMFFWERGAVSRQLRKSGFIIHLLDNATALDFQSPATEEEQEHNKRLMDKIYGPDALSKKMEGIVSYFRKQQMILA